MSLINVSEHATQLNKTRLFVFHPQHKLMFTYLFAFLTFWLARFNFSQFLSCQVISNIVVDPITLEHANEDCYEAGTFTINITKYRMEFAKLDELKEQKQANPTLSITKPNLVDYAHLKSNPEIIPHTSYLIMVYIFTVYFIYGIGENFQVEKKIINFYTRLYYKKEKKPAGPNLITKDDVDVLVIYIQKCMETMKRYQLNIKYWSRNTRKITSLYIIRAQYFNLIRNALLFIVDLSFYYCCAQLYGLDPTDAVGQLWNYQKNHENRHKNSLFNKDQYCKREVHIETSYKEIVYYCKNTVVPHFLFTLILLFVFVSLTMAIDLWNILNDVATIFTFKTETIGKIRTLLIEKGVDANILKIFCNDIQDETLYLLKDIDMISGSSTFNDIIFKMYERHISNNSPLNAISHSSISADNDSLNSMPASSQIPPNAISHPYLPADNVSIQPVSVSSQLFPPHSSPLNHPQIQRTNSLPSLVQRFPSTISLQSSNSSSSSISQSMKEKIQRQLEIEKIMATPNMPNEFYEPPERTLFRTPTPVSSTNIWHRNRNGAQSQVSLQME